GVAYYAPMSTDMVDRGFGTRAAESFGDTMISRINPVEGAIDALEAGIIKRRRRIVAPPWVAPILHVRTLAQRVVEAQARRGTSRALAIARDEHVDLTTPQDRPEVC